MSTKKSSPRVPTPDPIETIIRSALDREDFSYTEENDDANRGLDFHLSDYGIHIEVKQFHSGRIAKQMARSENIIVAQGREAAEFLAALLCDYQRESQGTVK